MEVCVDCFQSAVNAAEGGASRLELCHALNEGGLTPTPGMLEVIKSAVKIPIYVMLRPREGDFVYSSNEADIIKRDAEILKQYGADGFVFGALTKDSEVDQELCKDVVQLVHPLPVTFHRAFDVSKDPFVALETIINLGFKRILTSGQQYSAFHGISLIKKLIEVSQGRIVIMPGAGIIPSNLSQILKETGAQEFHASASITKSNDEFAIITRGPKPCSDGRKVTLMPPVQQMVETYERIKSAREKQ